MISNKSTNLRATLQRGFKEKSESDLHGMSPSDISHYFSEYLFLSLIEHGEPLWFAIEVSRYVTKRLGQSVFLRLSKPQTESRKMIDWVVTTIKIEKPDLDTFKHSIPYDLFKK